MGGRIISAPPVKPHPICRLISLLLAAVRLRHEPCLRTTTPFAAAVLPRPRSITVATISDAAIEVPTAAAAPVSVLLWVWHTSVSTPCCIASGPVH